MDTHDAVQTIANVFAAAEKRNSQTAKAVRALRDEFKAISDNGDAGSLLTSAFYAKAVAVTATSAAMLLELHQQMTDAAVELGIDVPPAVPGEDDDDIGILSGGGR